MAMNKELIETIEIPAKLRKKTTIASVNFYDRIDIFGNHVSGYKNGEISQSWYFKDYNGIDIVNASLNSQFAQVVFLNGINSKNRTIGIDFTSSQNKNAINDTNRFLLCGGMFSYSAANDLANYIGQKIRHAFEEYKNHEDDSENNSSNSVADELKKFKELLDMGILSQEEFDAKKKQLLGL